MSKGSRLKYVLFNIHAGNKEHIFDWLKDMGASFEQFDSPEEANAAVNWQEIAGVVVGANEDMNPTVDLAKAIRKRLDRPDVPVLVL